VDDPARYAVLWMNRAPLASAFQLEERSTTSVSLRSPAPPEREVAPPWTGSSCRTAATGPSAVKDQQSNAILTSELGLLEGLAWMMPTIFLGVAAFLVYMVLGRVITLQRPEIATLKAVGYGNGAVRAHFSGLVAVVLLPGTAMGLAGGWALGRLMLDLYASVFRFPDVRLDLTFARRCQLSDAGAAAPPRRSSRVRAAVRLPPPRRCARLRRRCTARR
jgi:putative ABC transport system permease protein